MQRPFLLHITFCIIAVIFSARIFAQNTVPTVDVVLPESEIQQFNIRLTGTVEAIQDANIAVQQPGVVTAFFADQGEQVKQGDKLLTLDDTLANYRLNELKALLTLSKIEHQEAQRLYQEVLALSKTQFVAQTLIQERQAAVARANASVIQQQASVDLQSEVLKQFTVYAPFDGVIGLRSADVGEWVVPQQPVFNLVSNRQLRLRVALPQEYFPVLLQQESVARVVPDMVGAKELLLPISQLVAVSNLSTRTVSALILLPESTPLIAGMSASVTLDVKTSEEAVLWLPETAIKTHPDGGSSVFAIENGTAKRYVVKIKKRSGKRVAVTGAQSGLYYVVKGVELLLDGQSVQQNLVEASTGAAQ